MDIAEHIAVLALEGERIASAGEEAGPDALVPTCPEWAVRDLLHHQGGLFRWSAGYVAGAVVERKGLDYDTTVGALPDDAHLIEWFGQCHADLVETLRSADPAVQTPEVVTPSFGADGLDELLAGFFARRQGDPRADPPRSLSVRCTDVDAGWRMTVSTESVTTTAEADAGATAPDCIVRGPASDLYHSLWNRLPADVLTIEGDSAALDLFMDQYKVRWSI